MNPNRTGLTVLLASGLFASAALPAQESARLLRFPHAHAGKVAFVKGGDLWIAGLDDGIARRLTSFDDGFEVMPRISPDGSLVAFSAEYSGSRQVWVVASGGGTPRQLTWYPDVGELPPRAGYDNLPYDWTPDGRFVAVVSNRTPYGERNGRYFLVPVTEPGLERPLQIPEGGPFSFSPDGTKLAYNPISREWRTWKRYTGGRSQDVWIYDLLQNRVEQITDFPGTDNWPMWIGERIYFTSDRTGTLNLWCVELGSKVTRQVTHFTDFDVLFPSRGDAGIAFEHGGDLWLMNAQNESVRKLTITLADDEPWTRPRWHQGPNGVAGFSAHPKAESAVVEFRGDLFLVPKNGPDAQPRNLTATPSRRERDPAFSPDGTQIAYLAESGDDYELFLRSLEHGYETRLTSNSSAWIQDVVWSPKGDRLAYTNTAGDLNVVDVATRTSRTLDHTRESTVREIAWSADGTWLCYSRTSPNGLDAIWVAPVEHGDPFQVTNDDWADSAPSFDPSGRWLYFASARDYVHGPAPTLQRRLFALILQKDGKSPLETSRRDGASEATNTSSKSTDPHAGGMRIDPDGLDRRIVVLPLPSGTGYGYTLGVDDGVVYHDGSGISQWTASTQKSAKILDGVFSLDLTADRKNFLYRHGQELRFARLAPGQSHSGDSLASGAIRLRVDPRTEWRQMYGEAWRVMRDFFYDPKMHGVDWLAMREKYAPLVAHVAHRADLDFLLGELIGELNCGHTYVNPGANPRIERVANGALGCEFEVVDGHYRVASIFAGANWDESTRNPLLEPGVDVKVGDFILAIDGVDVSGTDNLYRHLEGKAGRLVELTVNDKPRRFGSRTERVRAIASEVGLRYLTWVERNRRIVDEMSDGKIGYVHVPNTAVDGHRELFEGWLAQARTKSAFIIDDRYNGGGFIPDQMSFRIGQPVLNWWARRHRELGPTPGNAFDGPRVMLINGYSSSGGDAFPYYFRELKLGKLMGQRTWGGLVGYSGTPGMIDGGSLAVPGFAFVNKDGEWDVEAYGVEPDIEVFDDPTQIQAGREPMLEAAVRHLIAELAKSPPKSRPPVPDGPDRRGLVDREDAPFRRR